MFNGLIQKKLLLILVGLDSGRNMAQQVNSKVLLNRNPRDLDLNKENENGPTTTIYTKLLQFKVLVAQISCNQRENNLILECNVYTTPLGIDAEQR